MRDFDGGYSLFAPRKLFDFKDFKLHIALVSEQTARIMASCSGHRGAITCIAWSSDDEYIGTCSADGTLRLWNQPEWSVYKVFNVGTALSSCMFHPSNPDCVMISDSKSHVQSLSISAGSFKESIEFNDPIKATCFSPKGEMVLFGDTKGKVFVYKCGDSGGSSRPSEQMKKMTQEVLADRSITHICASQTGSINEAIISVNAMSNKVKLCRLKWESAKAQRARLETLKVFETTNRSSTIRAAFCPALARWPQSHSIVCGSEDGTVFIYNKDKGGEPWCNMLMGHEATVLGATWSGDGTILVTGDAAGAVVIWCRDPSNE